MSREGFTRPGERPLLAFVSSVMRPELDDWRRAAVDALSNRVLVPWAFEFTPASSQQATDAYLTKVREADFVIWLVGAVTTDPVRDEIQEALAANRRLWVMRLPVGTRDEMTETLLHAVGLRAKYADVTSPDHLREELTLTFGDEVVRALRDAPETTRLAYLEQAGRASRGRMIARWQAATLDRSIAVQLADEIATLTLDPALLPSDERRFRIAVAEVGAGKSLFAERAYQHGLVKAREHPSAPVPVFVRAREVGPSLADTAIARAEGLGDPRLQGGWLVVDGGDELPRDRAAQIVEEARALVEAWPDSTRITLTSRPTTALGELPEVFQMPLLDEDETVQLISKIQRREFTVFDLALLTPPIRDAVQRPLFAILYALKSLASPGVQPSVGELLADLAEGTARSVRSVRASPLLRRLATLTTELAGAVPARSLGRPEELFPLVESALIVESAGNIEFALPILEQWFAAQALLETDVDIEEIVGQPMLLDRWRYAIAIAISTGPEEFVDEVLDYIVRADPGFASEVIADSLIEDVSTTSGVVELDVLNAGRQLRRALQTWAQAVQPLGDEMFPLDSTGQLIPLAVGGGAGWFNVGWYSGEERVDEVVEFPQDIRNSPGWDWHRGSVWRGERGWAWRWGRDWTKDFLRPILARRGLQIDVPELVDEALWLAALTVDRKGSLYHGSVSVDLVLAGLAGATPGIPLRLNDRFASTDRVVARLDELIASGVTEIRSPWPGPDIEDARAGWIWGVYSPERQCERIAAVYAAAMRAYEVLVSTWFPRLRKRMLIASTLPARFDADFSPGERIGDSFPTLDWFFDPLQEGSESYASVRLVDGTTHHGTERWQEELLDRTRRLRQLRPEAAEWIYSTHTSGIADAFQGAPLAPLVYDWLRRDLRRLRLA